MRKFSGILTIFSLVVVTLTLWFLSKADASMIWSYPIKSLNQIFALLGVTLISIQAVLATRSRFLEKIFGGLDQVYLVHRVAGSLGYAIILQHPVMLILNVLPNTKSALSYLIPDISVPANYFGITALLILSILIFATLFIKLPYQIWKKTHILMSIPVALVFLHVVLINSDTSVFLPLKVWILTLIAISLVAGFYRRLLYSILAAHYSYVVSNIELAADIGVINITLSPLGEQKPMDHKPGDFVYIRFSNKQVGGEKHPFSISSYPGTNEMRLTIKMTGDFTRRLKHLKVGDKTTLWGPHGGFADAYHSNKQDQVWIAGGIGVTPFLSILPCEVQQQRQRISRINREVNFYYCVNTLPEAAFKDEIQQQCINAPSIMFRPFITQINGWLTAERIVADIGDKIFTSKIFLCGPQVMMESLTKQLNKVGVKNKQIFFENFSFVS